MSAQFLYNAAMYARIVPLTLLVVIALCVPAARYFYYTSFESPEHYAERLAQEEGIVARFQEELPDKTKTRGPAFALRAVFTATKNRAISSGECHLLLHNVGHAALNLSVAEVGQLLNVAEVRTCLGGYLHGMEAEILESGQDVQKRAWRLCEETRAAGIANGPCFHGFGHAAMEWTQDVEQALTLCDSLAGGPEKEMSGCYRGVFSQLSDYIAGMAEGKNPFPEVDPSNAFAYCRTLQQKFQSSCQSQLSQRYNDVGNPLQGVQNCLAASKSHDERDVCANILTSLETRKAYDENREESMGAFFATIPIAQQPAALSGMYESHSAAKDTYPGIRPWSEVCATVVREDAEACARATGTSLQ